MPASGHRGTLRPNAWSLLAFFLAVLSLLPESILFRTREWRSAPLLRREAARKRTESVHMRVTLSNVLWLVATFALTFTLLFGLGVFFGTENNLGLYAGLVVVVQIMCRPTSNAYLHCILGRLRRDPRWQSHSRVALTEPSEADLGPLIQTFAGKPKNAGAHALVVSIPIWGFFAAILAAAYLLSESFSLLSSTMIVLGIGFVLLNLLAIQPALWYRTYSLHEHGFVVERRGGRRQLVPFSHVEKMIGENFLTQTAVHLKDGRSLHIHGGSTFDESLEYPAFTICRYYGDWRRRARECSEAAAELPRPTTFDERHG